MSTTAKKRCSGICRNGYEVARLPWSGGMSSETVGNVTKETMHYGLSGELRMTNGFGTIAFGYNKWRWWCNPNKRKFLARCNKWFFLLVL
ncbi:hypothetical protein [Flavobacterium sp. LM4]|uniref:hypothetical protein n=1 Tax=Flavobacterium sp. LM4 TaxID=1938609 RepID=UPI000F50239F|nr:hypothetical protein [Flavobacterium sp. LM4]